MSIIRFAGRHWASYVRDRVLPDLTAYEECVSARLLRSFDSLDAEVTTRAEEVLARISSDVCEYDSHGAAEHANDVAIEWGTRVSSMIYTTTALFTAGLYHSLEQQAAELYREAMRLPLGDAVGTGQIRIEQQVKTWLSDLGIDCETCPAWSKVYGELRHVANVCKHAEGDSAQKLRACRPDLFQIPHLRGTDTGAWLSRGPVRRPLAGESIWVEEADFTAYAEAVRSFWMWLATRFDQEDGRPLK